MIKRKILSWLTVAAIIISVMPYTTYAADFGGGSGTPDDPYQISTV